MFFRPPVPRKIEFGAMFLTLMFPFTVCLFLMVYLFTHEDVTKSSPFLFPVIVLLFPSGVVDPVKSVQRISIYSLQSLSVLILFVTMLLILKTKNMEILKLQWRSLFVLAYSTVTTAFNGWILFVYDAPIENILDHASCVAANPQVVPSPCKRNYGETTDKALLGTSILILVSGPLILSIVVLTNELVVNWWKNLFTKGEFLMAAPAQRANNSSGSGTSQGSMHEVSMSRLPPKSSSSRTSSRIQV